MNWSVFLRAFMDIFLLLYPNPIRHKTAMIDKSPGDNDIMINQSYPLSADKACISPVKFRMSLPN